MKKKELKKLIKEEWYNLKENADEDTPQQSSIKGQFNIVVTAPDEDINDLKEAFEDINNYGIYVSNLRKDPKINTKIEQHFGNLDDKGKKIYPVTKKKLEKERGEPFPIKTKDNVDNLIKDMIKNGEIDLVSFEEKDDSLIFPHDSNPNKNVTKKIIDTVLKNAEIIDYEIEEKSTI